jgi:hypothetical protein
MRCSWLLGTAFGLCIGACFSEPDEDCSPGSEGCVCVDLQCEADLSCRNGRCVAPGGTTGGASTTTDMTTTDEPSTTSDATTFGTSDVSTSNDSMADADESSTGEPLCGNGELDPDEQCDGTPACTDCTLDNYDCNPLNNAGCPDGSKCSFHDESGQFWCLPFSKDPPGTLHEGNCYSGGPQDQWCDVGLACMPAQTTNACESGGCCVEFCDIFDAESDCAQDGDQCVVWFEPDADPGLAWLGVCMTP